MSAAKIRVTGTEMVRLLKLPPDTVAQPIVLTVEHGDIPEGAEEVEPVYRLHHRAASRFLHWSVKR